MLNVPIDNVGICGYNTYVQAHCANRGQSAMCQIQHIYRAFLPLVFFCGYALPSPFVVAKRILSLRAEYEIRNPSGIEQTPIVDPTF